MIIDRVSNSSKLRDINPMVKFIFAMGAIIMMLINTKLYVFGLNFLLFNYLLIRVLELKNKDIITLYKIPLFFILTSLLALILSGQNPIVFFMRAITSISAIYFLLCSTPITDIDYVFEKFRFPIIFRELFLLMYKYIFLLIDQKNKIITAQMSRLGYSTFSQSCRSFAMLVVNLFRKTFYYSEKSKHAVDARLGHTFIFYRRKYRKIGKEIIWIVIFFLINISLMIINLL